MIVMPQAAARETRNGAADGQALKMITHSFAAQIVLKISSSQAQKAGIDGDANNHYCEKQRGRPGRELQFHEDGGRNQAETGAGAGADQEDLPVTGFVGFCRRLRRLLKIQFFLVFPQLLATVLSPRQTAGNSAPVLVYRPPLIRPPLTRFFRMAYRAACVRLFTSSFCRILATWVLTVFSLKNKDSAISLLLKPRAISASTSSSRLERGSSVAPAPVLPSPSICWRRSAATCAQALCRRHGTNGGQELFRLGILKDIPGRPAFKAP